MIFFRCIGLDLFSVEFWLPWSTSFFLPQKVPHTNLWQHRNLKKKFHSKKFRLVIYASQFQFYEMFQIASYCLNGCLCVDLFLTFKNPFSPSGRRLKFYFIFTGIVVSIITIKTINKAKNKTIDKFHLWYSFRSIPNQCLYCL